MQRKEPFISTALDGVRRMSAGAYSPEMNMGVSGRGE